MKVIRVVEHNAVVLVRADKGEHRLALDLTDPEVEGTETIEQRRAAPYQLTVRIIDMGSIPSVAANVLINLFIWGYEPISRGDLSLVVDGDIPSRRIQVGPRDKRPELIGVLALV
jgi:hypothetical protein